VYLIAKHWTRLHHILLSNPVENDIPLNKGKIVLSGKLFVVAPYGCYPNAIYKGLFSWLRHHEQTIGRPRPRFVFPARFATPQ
jgi:hypothetical protein